MAEINLLQNRVKDTTNTLEKQRKIILSILSLILAIILSITGILFVLNNSIQRKIDAVTADNNNLQQQFTKQQKNLTDAKTFQAQLANLSVLLNNHAYLSPFLDELTKATYQKTRYVSVDISEGHKIHLEGSVNSYADLGKMLLGLATSAKFSNIKLLSTIPAAGKTSGFLFSVDMNASPDIFTKNK